MRDLDYYDGPTTGNYDEVTRAALFTVGGFENLEERLVEDARIDQDTLDFLRAKRNREAHRPANGDQTKKP